MSEEEEQSMRWIRVEGLRKEDDEWETVCWGWAVCRVD